jgi:hypothetical protein
MRSLAALGLRTSIGLSAIRYSSQRGGGPIRKPAPLGSPRVVRPKQFVYEQREDTWYGKRSGE